MTLRHAGSLKKLVGVLGLVEEEPTRRAMNPDAEKVVKIAHVRHGELALKLIDDVSKKGRR